MVMTIKHVLNYVFRNVKRCGETLSLGGIYYNAVYYPKLGIVT